MTPADNELIRRIVAQDAAAFELLHLRYEDLVRRHLRGIVRDAHAAEDLLQEAFLRVWTRADQFVDRDDFKAWLLRVATNLALNHLRSRRRRRESPLELPAEPLDAEGEETYAPAWMIDRSTPGPDAMTELREQRRLLREAVSRLPEAKRQAVRLVYEAELDLSQAAALLEVPLGTVKSRLHYAAKTMARELEALDGERRPPDGESAD